MDTHSTSWPKIKKSIYKNCGVCVRFIVDDSHDGDDTKTDTYYGQIEEIRELYYVGLKVALFRCRWVTPMGRC
jgi:hypothetical protein